MKDRYSLEEFYGQQQPVAQQVVAQPEEAPLQKISLEEFYKPEPVIEQPKPKQANVQEILKPSMAGLPLGMQDIMMQSGEATIPKPPTQREAGLAARSVLQGVAAPVTFGADVLGAGVNLASGKEVVPNLSKMVSEALTDVGLPEAQGSDEQIASDILEGFVGGSGVAKLGQKLLAGTAGAMGAGSASAAKEMGAGTGTQIAAGLTGGLLGTAGAKTLVQAISQKPDALLKDISQRGIDDVASFINVRSDIVKNAARLSKRKNELYSRAKELGKESFVDRDKIGKFADNVEDFTKEVFDPAGRQTVANISDRLREIASQAKPDVNELMVVRRGLSKLSNSPDSGIRNAAGQIKGQLDEFLKAPDTVKGSKKAVRVWNNAIKSQREYSSKFEDVVEIAKAVDDTTNEVVEQAFIGSGGAALNKNLSNVYDSAIKAVPSNKRKLTGFRLKQSIVNRMVKNAAQSVDDAEGVSASRLANQIRNFRRDNQSMWAKFNEGEKRALTRLETSLRKEMKGGVVNRIYQSVEKFIKGGLGQNIELPRTLKPKTVVDIDDLLELTTVRASAPTGKAIYLGVDSSVEPEALPQPIKKSTPEIEQPKINTPMPTNELLSKIDQAIAKKQQGELK